MTKTSRDEKADRFNAEVNEIAGESPDAVVIIGFGGDPRSSPPWSRRRRRSEGHRRLRL
ncbi:MAG: hypothetical protein R2749_04320 [Acidimicrobiales bacterium]